MTSAALSATFEQEMDTILKLATDGLPGVVVLAKRGEHTYHKAAGFADREAQVPMEKDMPFRMYSMTKVMTSTLALILQDKVKEPAPEDAVSKYIPSFGREWDVVEEAMGAEESVNVRSMIAGSTDPVAFRRQKATRQMCVKDLMSECSGVGYESFSDEDKHIRGGETETKHGFAIANALRRQVCPTVYTSSCILGHDASIEQFSEVIAEAGVLCTDPGCFSYGLGAAVLGRVVEVVYAKHFEPKPLRDIFQELLFKPLGMSSAVFFDKNLAASLPKLYGIKRSAVDGVEHSIMPAELSVPDFVPPYSNQSDHYSGPMKCDSGDTGSVMSVGDYAKFLECLLRGGTASDGTQVLSPEVVQTLLHGRHGGLSFETGLGKKMGLSNEGTVFSYGWATQKAADGVPKQNFWSGYAGTHVRLYAEDNSYIILAIQCMDHAGTGLLNGKFRQPCLETFLKHWTPEQPNVKRQRNE